MGEALVIALYFALIVGLAAPLIPLARRLARLCIRGWKDAVLALAFMFLIGYLTFSPASMLGVLLAALLTLIISPIIVFLAPQIGAPQIGQGAIAFLFVWVGAWAVGVSCAGCLATFYFDAWWNKRSS